MSKLYNTFDNVSSNILDFFNNINLPISKPNKKVLAFIIPAMIKSESIVTADISKSLNSASFSSNDDSNQKRIWRFTNNKNVNIYDVFDSIIKAIINNISNIKHDKLVVTMDHMFTKNNFVTLMFTLKIDNQGIPLCFFTERTSSNCHSEIQKNSRKKLFSEKFIKEAIDKVIELLSPLNTKITFLADRWFFNLKILKHIEDAGQFFCFRAKANSSVKVYAFDKKEKHYIYKHLSDFNSTKNRSKYYENIEFGDMQFKCNLSVSRDIANNEEENWYIISNIEPNKAIRTYSKRFGCIEMFFKSQKTNGFYLESTKTKNLHAFETIYGVACIAALWLNIIAVDYIKNYNHCKKKINIRLNKKNKNGKLKRILSTFKLGLYLFKKVFSSTINYKLKTNFKLYL